MWSSENKGRNRKVIALADGGYYEEEIMQPEGKKLSRVMAMLLGVILTIEIMIAGAMVFNINFFAADAIAVVLAFVVLYFGVVAALTNK